MKSIVRNTLLACTAMGLSLGLSMSAAEAQSNTKQVRIAQERLIELGYFVGHTDGVMGPQTVNAVLDFQYRMGLPATGTLNAQTYSALKEAYYSAVEGGYRYGYNGYNGYYAPANYYNHVTDPAYYHTVRYTADGAALPWTQEQTATAIRDTRVVPIRYANLAINEENHGVVSNYSVTLNGAPVLYADNQATPVRVSNSYTVNGEENVVLTVSDASSACGYKNFLLTVYRDGSHKTAHEVEPCVDTAELTGNQ